MSYLGLRQVLQAQGNPGQVLQYTVVLGKCFTAFHRHPSQTLWKVNFCETFSVVHDNESFIILVKFPKHGEAASSS